MWECNIFDLGYVY